MKADLIKRFFLCILFVFMLSVAYSRDNITKDTSLTINKFTIKDAYSGSLRVTNNGSRSIESFSVTLLANDEISVEEFHEVIAAGQNAELFFEYDFSASDKAQMYISSVNNTPFSGTICKSNTDREYCEVSSGCDEHINYVEFIGQFQNYSSCGNGGYENFTSINATVQRGASYDLIITNGLLSYPDDYCGIWIDWNQNEDFYDDEQVTVFGSPGIGPYTAIINVPEDAVVGETRMRLRIVWQNTLDPCGTSNYGETEDYTLNVVDNSGTISGTVTDYFSQQPVYNAVVTCGNHTANTNTVGYYIINGVLPGTYNLSCSSPEYNSTNYSDIVLADNQNLTLDFQLAPLANSPYSLTSEVNSFNQVILDWQYEHDQNLNCCGFYIYRDNELIATIADDSTAYYDNDLPAGTYIYNVKACYDDFTILSHSSNYVTEHILLPPPLNLTIEVIDNNAYLSWFLPEASRSLTGFNIYRNTQMIATCPGTQTTYTDDNLSQSSYNYYLTCVYSGGYESGISNTVDISIINAEDNSLSGINKFSVYPNPFNPQTIINYTLQKPGAVRIEVFSIKGDKITTLSDEYKNAGEYTCVWNAENLPSGLYMVRLATLDYSSVKKVMLLK